MASEKTCEVHGTVLHLRSVPVTYGRPVPDPELWEARKKLFPNAKSFVLGGCCVGSMGDEYEDWVCSECRKAEAKWRMGPYTREEPWQHWTEK